MQKLLQQDLHRELNQLNPSRVRWVDLANRVLHSEIYQVFYLAIGLLSLLLLCLSLFQQSHSSFYWTLEIVVNLVMVLEYFWESWSNCADVALIILCLLCLWWLPLGQAESVDALVLLLRNGLQAIRMFTALQHERARRRSRQQEEIFIDLEQQ